MPAMQDPYFAKSVTFICTHNQDGAMGIIINRPTDMNIQTLFEKINIPIEDQYLSKQPVLYGGPVQPERGFVLHASTQDQILQEWNSSVKVSDQIVLTTSKDILEAAGLGAGPNKLLLSLGYAGWTAGQLEAEILQNAWLSVQTKDADVLNKIVFDTAHEEKLAAAIKLLGIDPAMLSDVAGHA
jgi:putative transcriptional regulator